MNPILVHYLSCRRNWSLSVRCFLLAAGVVLLFVAGRVSASDAARGSGASAAITSGD
jgi:hypothetical protein